MNETRHILESIVNDFSIDKFKRFFREKSRQFVSKDESYSQYNDDKFKDGIKIGEINFSETESILICTFKGEKELSERRGKKAQYEKAKSILKSIENQNRYSAGIFIFYDPAGNFRFSLVYPESIGAKRQWNYFRRYTYFVSSDPKITNKTFYKQIGEKEIKSLDDIKSAFSLTAVTKQFYDEFFDIFDALVKATEKINDTRVEKVRDFVLLFTIRSIFIGFIQKKKWIGNDEDFIQNFFLEYKSQYFGQNKFYSRWLKPLFFEALNTPQGHKVSYKNNEFSEKTEHDLQMAPYLNGGLFKEKNGYDDKEWIIPDRETEKFFDFLFSHSFTIEENSLEDEDLQLNPEFLGIIFERLVNKEDGAVYTPRTEVDLMCRLSLLKWLQKNLSCQVRAKNLYELFFKESEKEEDQKSGSFSPKEAQEILDKLETISICDPAVGSGAFLVGMIQVLDDVEETLKNNYGLNGKNTYDRKKEIIKNTLYGVEVKEWAVWICQLRLWLSLFVDAPESLKDSLDPILPSLEFKVRQGDSLVQLVGSKLFPISGHNLALSSTIKGKITQLKSLKLEYFDNQTKIKDWELKEREKAIYEEIIFSEIKELTEKIKAIKNTKHAKKLSLFGISEETQSELEFDKDKITELEDEINNLQEQRQALRGGNKPLVWGIEFAEIFGEKGGFDVIIGNPPYVRQEDIEDPTGTIKDKKEYKALLSEMVKLDFPNDFPPKSKINGQSDLYTYFYIRGLRLLNPNGIHTFICSNSWLDVGYGVWLQKFLLDRSPVEFIIDNHAKRSFEAADVNTIISLIHAPEKNQKVDPNHITKFVALKKPFEEMLYTENLIEIEKAKEITSNEMLRVYPITNEKLEKAGSEFENEAKEKLGAGEYIGDKWEGKYLRAPDIFWKLVEKGKGGITKLKKLGAVRYPIKTGVNEFFYLNKSESSKIESIFLLPIVKSSKEFDCISPNKDKLEYQLFRCNLSKEELSLGGFNKALDYVSWGEKQKTKARQKTDAGIPWNQVASVSGRKFWYSINEIKPADIICNRFFNERFFYGFLDFDIIEDQTFYGLVLYPKYQKHKKNIAAFLNSTVSFLFTELLGRVALGEGILQYARYEMANNLLFLDTQIIDNPDLLLSFDRLRHRPITSVFNEVGLNPELDIPISAQEPKPLPDRAELDKIVFDALGLTENERKEVYRAVCRLVWNRISKAQSI